MLTFSQFKVQLSKELKLSISKVVEFSLDMEDFDYRYDDGYIRVNYLYGQWQVALEDEDTQPIMTIKRLGTISKVGAADSLKSAIVNYFL